MKKHNKRKHIKTKKTEEKEEPQTQTNQTKQPSFQSTFSFLKKAANNGWKIFAGIALIIGLVATFYPKIEVSIDVCAICQ